jgi:biotin transport system substrate-specific component
MTASTVVERRGQRPVLADLLPASGARVGALVPVIGGAALTGLAAQISVPVPGSPVPVTGQTFAVLLAGAALGTRRAAASMALYVLAGFAGVPWFAGGAHGTLSAPTLGYLIGFIVAGAAVGRLAERGADRSPWKTALAMVLGNAVIYAFGVTYLALSLHVSARTAVSLGLTPFLLGDALKVVLASGVLPGVWHFVGRR